MTKRLKTKAPWLGMPPQLHPCRDRPRRMSQLLQIARCCLLAAVQTSSPVRAWAWAYPLHERMRKKISDDGRENANTKYKPSHCNIKCKVIALTFCWIQKSIHKGALAALF